MARRATKMSQDLSEVSVAIGELRAGQAANHQSLHELRTDVKTILNNMTNLPPSPVCLAAHTQLNSRIDDQDKKVAWLSAKVGTAIAVLAAGGKIALNKLGIDI